MKFSKISTKKKDSIIRYRMIQNGRCLEIIFVDFFKVFIMPKKFHVRKIIREDNNSKENIGTFAMNSYLKITHTIIAMELAYRSPNPLILDPWKIVKVSLWLATQNYLLVPCPGTLRHSRVISRVVEIKKEGVRGKFIASRWMVTR